MTQLGLFAIEEAPAAVMAPVSCGADGSPWLSDEVAVRREFALRSAALWQGYHDASGLPHTADGIYAVELRALAADMDADPEYYRRRPATHSDVRWFREKGGAA